jgi:hypothetical protein
LRRMLINATETQPQSKRIESGCVQLLVVCWEKRQTGDHVFPREASVSAPAEERKGEGQCPEARDEVDKERGCKHECTRTASNTQQPAGIAASATLAPMIKHPWQESSTQQHKQSSSGRKGSRKQPAAMPGENGKQLWCVRGATDIPKRTREAAIETQGKWIREEIKSQISRYGQSGLDGTKAFARIETFATSLQGVAKVWQNIFSPMTPCPESSSCYMAGHLVLLRWRGEVSKSVRVIVNAR